MHEDSAPLRRMAVFDVVVNNADRKGGHVLEMPDGHRYGVDHGVAFHPDHKLRTVLWGWAGYALEPEELAGVESVLTGLDGDLRERLEDLLAVVEVDAVARRCERLLRRGDWIGWQPTQLLGRHVSGKTVGIIGMGRIGQAIARRISAGKHVLLADLRKDNAEAAAEVLADAGFEVSTATVDVSSRQSVHALAETATALGEVNGVIHAAGVSPSQAAPETILAVDLYGTALVLEEFGAIIAPGGSGVVIASQSGHRLGALTADQDGWTLDHRRTAYDLDQVIADLHAVGHPLASWLAGKMRQARATP